MPSMMPSIWLDGSVGFERLESVDAVGVSFTVTGTPG